jgi:hypothetical protein
LLTDENNDTSGLPEEPIIILDENFNIDDFFVKPEGREDLSDNNYEATNADIEDQTTTYSAPPTDEANDK